MNEKICLFKSRNELAKLGYKIFLIGILFLPSVPAISVIFILPALFLGFISKSNFLKDKLNLFFLLISIFMTVASTSHFLGSNTFEEITWNNKLSFIGLLNWIPLFLVFYSSQIYLENRAQRTYFSLFLLFGSIPVILSGFGQYFLKWEGPFEFLNGIIVWFMKPIESHADGLSGLFSNQNYAGTWFSIIWPFCFTFFLIAKTNSKKRWLFAIFLILISISLFLTFSKNAFLGILIAFPLIIGIKGFFIIGVVLFTMISFSIMLNTFPFFFQELGLNPLMFENYSEIFLKPISRIRLWKETLILLIKKPIFGWGIGFLPAYFVVQNNSNPEVFKEVFQHSHNIFLELGIGYGFIVAFLISMPIIYILKTAWPKVYKNNVSYHKNLLDRSWLASTIIICFSQMFDISYYDGRISFIFWILLAGSYQISKKV